MTYKMVQKYLISWDIVICTVPHTFQKVSLCNSNSRFDNMHPFISRYDIDRHVACFLQWCMCTLTF